MKGRIVLLAILTYVALDSSLPAMPGAFVFEPDDSVESAHGRGRHAVKVTALSAPSGHSPMLLRPCIDLRHRLPPISHIVCLPRSAAHCLPRSICAPSPLSEDPH